MKPTRDLEDGEPCQHLGCERHISHPCECCGRIGARGKYKLPAIQVHTDKSPGLTVEQPVLTRCENCGGSLYWKAVAQIGSIFGHKVDGQITGIGKTREIALARLEEERKKLYESLWV